MRAIRLPAFLAVTALFVGCPAPQPPDADRTLSQDAGLERPDLGRHFGELEGTFVLLDGQTGERLRYNPERAATRFLPASTFKIANTLIALETGVVAGPEAPLTRDTLQAPRQDWWPASWAQDHTLSTAMRGSVVWYYQELARRVGRERMQSYLERFDYGNRDASGGIDQFWLTGGLGISADEQVDFLRRFFHGELGVDERSTGIVKEMLILEDTPDYRLSGKSGWVGLGEADAPQVGWLVGYLERGTEVHFFATNIRMRSGQDASARMNIVRAVLGELGLLAPDPDRVRAIVDAAIRPVLEEHDVPGMAVAVTVGGAPLFFNYGVAARDGGAPVTEETIFELGSVSKTFTATLGSYAWATGRLSLDDPPGRFLPELAGSALDGVTLLHLGTYTTGGFPLQFPDGVSDEAGMIRYFREWQPEAAPGAERRYSNPSIGLFGRAAALALEGDFAQLVESQILGPLGLGQTHFTVPEEAMARYAWGHNAAGDPIRVNPGMFDVEAYGLKSTAADLIRFVQWNMDPSGLEEPLRQAIKGTHLGHFRVGDMVQGLGWEQYSFPVALDRLLAGNSTTMSMQANAVERLTPPQAPSAPTLFNKTGSTGGFGAYVAFIPERDVGVVMLANRNLPNAARVEAVYTILEQLLGEGR